MIVVYLPTSVRHIFSREYNLKLVYVFCFIFLFPTFAKANEPLRVGLIEGGRAPYFFAHDNPRTGLYKDILTAISRLTGVKFSFDYYPQARLRKMMISGNLDVEMGTDPLWRRAANEVNQSVYSDPFMQSTESWVVALNNKDRIDTLIATPGVARPCLVLGFNVETNMKKANDNVKGNSDQHLLNMLVRNRCDIALIPDVILEYYHVVEDKRFVLSPAKNKYQLSIRFGKKHQSFLPKINKALREIKQSGELQQLMNKYGINHSY